MTRYREAVHFIGYFILMLLISLAEAEKSIATLHTGLYVALVYAGESTPILSIIYLLAGIIAHPTLTTLLLEILPVVLMNVTVIILRHYHKRMSILVATISGVISVLPVLIIGILNTNKLIEGILSLIVTAIFTYLAIIATYAVIVKKLRTRLSSDEIVSLLVILLLVASGIYNIAIYEFRFYYVIMALGILILSYICTLESAFLIGLAYGIGGGVMGANLKLAGVIVIMMAVCYMFGRYNRYFSAVSLIALDVLFLTCYNVYEDTSYLHIIAVLIGVIIYIIIPTKKLTYYRNIYGNRYRNNALQSYIDRNRMDTTAKISNLSLLFADIESSLTDNEYILTRNRAKEAISESIMCAVCCNCPNRETCFHALGGDTLSQISLIVDKASLGKATMDDLSTFLESRCDKGLEIVNLANEYYSKYVNLHTHICGVLDNKHILGEQIGSIGGVLKKLSNDVLSGVSHNAQLEERLSEELSVQGIVVSDVLVIENNSGSPEITLVVKNGDRDKRIIRGIIERLFSIKMDRFIDRACEIDGFSVLRFVPRPMYSLSYGISSIKKDGSPESGDTHTLQRLGRDKVALGICDGKGSGDRAHINSNNTINIVEKLYRAGFTSDIILSFTNRLLTIRNSEDFSALDMAVVDLQMASVDFIKLGGVTSYIKRASSIDRIEGSALPIGVLEEAEPSIIRRALSSGDVVFMVSDGVTDALGDDKIIALLGSMVHDNVQTMADSLIEIATSNGAIDDTTVIAFKLLKA